MSIQDCKVIGANVAPDVYLRQAIDVSRGSADYVMSRSDLCEFARCPERWRAGMRFSGNESSEWGDLIDALTLGGDFASRFAVHPETYPDKKTGEPKKWNLNSDWCKDWKKAQGGKRVISQQEHIDADAAAKAILCAPECEDMLESSEFQVMVCGFWKDRATGLLIPLKVLTDIVPSKLSGYANCEADLKTARNASPGAWPRECFSHGYHVQAAMNLDLWNAATDEERTDWLHLIQENSPPYQLAFRHLSLEFLSLGRAIYRNALTKYAACLKSNHWPNYEDGRRQYIPGWSVVEPEAWMLKDPTQDYWEELEVKQEDIKPEYVDIVP